MASIIRPLRRILLCPPKTLVASFQLTQQNPISLHNNKINEVLNPFCSSQIQTRNYMSDMRNSAFKDNILRLLRNEIQYGLDHSPPLQPAAKFNDFTIDYLPGEQWIRLKGKFAENEEIKVEATMFDAAIPVQKSSSGGIKEDVKLHITLIVNVFKGEGNALEILCSAWPDSIEITKLFIRKDKMSSRAYVGPEFKELDDELQDSLYDYLEARGINDDLATFLHGYMKNKGKTEYIRWMETVKSYIEKQ